MKLAFVFIMLITQLAFGDAVIFSGNDVKTLKPNIDLFGTAKILGVSSDPTSGGGLSAPLASIAMNYLTGSVYIKTGSGATQWSSIVSGVSPITSVTASSPLASSGGTTPNISLTGVVSVANGGTNISSYSAGDLLYASSSSTVAKLPIGSSGQYLIVSGGSPSWQTVSGTGVTAVTASGPIASSGGSTPNISLTGNIPVTNGGTNISSYSIGDILYASASSTLSKLGIGSPGQVLGISGSSPVWQNANAGDVVGPASAVADDVATYNGTTGKLIKDSGLSSSLISGAAQKSANLSDLASASTARTNLGLGTAAVKDIPASGDASTSQVVYGTDTRLTDSRPPNGSAGGELSGSYPNPTLLNSAVIGKVITGFVSASGTVSATDTILQAIDKLDGNINGKQASGNYITALTGDVTASGPGSSAATIANNAVTNAKAAQMATNTIKGNNTGLTANASDLTATQVTAMLNNMVGDSGSGGTKGLVPAPAAGDSAAGKFLKADGTWTAPSGSGDVVGPASAVADDIATYNGTTGKLIKDSGIAVSLVSGAAQKSANLSDLASASTARTNLGLGTAAVKDIPASGDASVSQVVYGTDTRLTDSRAPNGSAGGDLTGTYPNPTITSSTVTGKLITGFVSASGTVTASDTILQAIDKLDGNINGKQDSGNYITALTGDVTASGPGSSAATIANNAVTNAKAAQMAANTIKGNNTGLTANASDLTATQVTAMLNGFVGDSGSGGTKGLVPAPASGDASKYLKGDGTWGTVSGSGDFLSNGSVAMTNAFRAVASGTAATPAITFNGSISTGLYNNSSSMIGFSTAGADAMRITPLGLVGIGTTAPVDIFHTLSATSGRIFQENNGTTLALKRTTGLDTNQQGGVSFLVGTANNETARIATIQAGATDSTAGGSLQFQTKSNGGSLTERMRMTASGNIGIATTNPAYNLDVSGTLNALTMTQNGVSVAVTGSPTFTSGISITRAAATPYQPTSSSVQYPQSSGPTMSMLNSSNTNATGPILSLRGNNSSGNNQAAYIALVSASGAASYIPSLAFGQSNGATSYAESMRIDGSGNVGIGTTTPGSMLDVAGTLRLDGSSSGYVGLKGATAAGSTTYTLPSSDGANGQVLQTNGSGVMTWGTASGTAGFFGGMTLAGNTSGCTFGENNSTGVTDYRSLAGATGCAAWSINSGSGSISAVGTNDVRMTITNMPIGEYMFVLTGAFEATTSGFCNFRITDGTINSTPGMILGNTNVAVPSMIFHMSITSSGTRTINVQAADGISGNCNWNGAVNYPDLSWKIYKF